MITQKDFDQIKFAYHMKGQVSGDDAGHLIDIINRMQTELEWRSQPAQGMYYEDEQRIRTEARVELAMELKDGLFDK